MFSLLQRPDVTMLAVADKLKPLFGICFALIFIVPDLIAYYTLNIFFSLPLHSATCLFLPFNLSYRRHFIIHGVFFFDLEVAHE